MNSALLPRGFSPDRFDVSLPSPSVSFEHRGEKGLVTLAIPVELSVRTLEPRDSEFEC